MAIAAAAAIVGAGVSIYKVLHNAHKEKEARREAERLKRPDYGIPDEYYQNRNIAGQLAQQGLPSGARDYYTSELDRGFGTGVSNILQAGGDANDINKLFDTYNRSLSNEAAIDAQTQLKNIEYFTKANADLADQQTIKYALNQKQPYENKLAEITQRRAAAQENINQGLGETVGSLGSLATILQNSNLGKGGGDEDGGGSVRGYSHAAGNYGVETVGNNSAVNNSTAVAAPVSTQQAAFKSDVISNLSDNQKLELVRGLLKTT